MMKRVASSLMVLMVMVTGAAAAPQVIVQDGPPPALRKNIDAFKAALNGSAAEYETMAKSVFSDELFKSQTPAQRKADWEKIHSAFGTVGFPRIDRNGGPEAPLQISVKGSLGEGVLWVTLDDDTSKFTGIKPEFPKK
jgi:hypothetical protein